MTLTGHKLLLLTAIASAGLQAALTQDALFSFPAQTEYFEFEDLAALRKLPNFNALRERYAGKSLEEAQLVLGQLGIPSGQVEQMVAASSVSGLYGVVTGSFSGNAIARRPANKRFAIEIAGHQAFQTGRGTCVIILEDSLAAFGSRESLELILEARQGIVTRLSARGDFVALLNSTEAKNPVHGIMVGNQLHAGITDWLKDLSGWNRDWSAFATHVKGISYSVKPESQAHFTATLDCASPTDAALLAQLLNAFDTFQSVANSTAKRTGPPFRNLKASASGAMVQLQADTTL